MKVNLTIGIPVWLDKIFARPVMEWRRRKYGYCFRRIYLGEGEWAMLDEKDYYELNDYKWVISGNGSKFYAVRLVKKGPGKTKIEYLHRVIMQPGDGLLVDHKNRNTFDNRRENLRSATQSQNHGNSQPDKTNASSKFKGVSFYTRTKRWMAKIKFEGKAIWLGYHDCEIEAAKAYDAAAKKYFGEFARLNFPENTD